MSRLIKITITNVLLLIKITIITISLFLISGCTGFVYNPSKAKPERLYENDSTSRSRITIDNYWVEKRLRNENLRSVIRNSGK